jgi:hypothetical protein
VAAQAWNVEALEIVALAPDALRANSSDLADKPGLILDHVLRHGLLVVKRGGRDVAVMVDVTRYNELVAPAGSASMAG